MLGTTTDRATAAAKQTKAWPLGMAALDGTSTRGCTSGWVRLGRGRSARRLNAVESGSATTTAPSVAASGIHHRRLAEIANAIPMKISPENPTTESTFISGVTTGRSSPENQATNLWSRLDMDPKATPVSTLPRDDRPTEGDPEAVPRRDP